MIESRPEDPVVRGKVWVLDRPTIRRDLGLELNQSERRGRTGGRAFERGKIDIDGRRPLSAFLRADHTADFMAVAVPLVADSLTLDMAVSVEVLSSSREQRGYSTFRCFAVLFAIDGSVG